MCNVGDARQVLDKNGRPVKARDEILFDGMIFFVERVYNPRFSPTTQNILIISCLRKRDTRTQMEKCLMTA